ncbi:hypothetical protein ACQ5SO_12205 [Rhodovulum sp. DZ06]|uniref:hypothetical protein n=1 Tax=Rhodovulum sp. DZ06 TaxID=3425126 RepID=UPI003D341E6B
MTRDSYISHLEDQLARVDADLALARKRIDDGPAEGRAKALDDWSGLKIRHEDLAARIQAAKAEGADKWSALHAGFREEADALSDALERWLEKAA